jgi:hypothetical protein
MQRENLVAFNQDVLEPPRKMRLEADTVVLTIDVTVPDNDVAGVANVQPIKIVGIGRCVHRHMVKKQLIALPVELSPHAGVAEGDVAHDDIAAVEYS